MSFLSICSIMVCKCGLSNYLLEIVLQTSLLLYGNYLKRGFKDEVASRSSSQLGRNICLEVKAAGDVAGGAAF